MTEFALVVLVFLFMFFAIIDFSRLMFMYHHVGNAAREGSRYAIVHGSTSGDQATQESIQNHIRSISPLDANNLIVTPEWENPADPKPGTWVKVRVRYNFTFSLPGWFGSGIPLSSTSQMVISY